ncbi:MAG: helix-turn-helix domain-containing protein [archaeon]
MDRLLEKLRNAGLTGNESKIYLELLKKEELSANELAKSISMDRTLTYTVLNHLIDKGLVGHIIKGNKKIFNALDPENLLNPVREKTAYIKDIIPELKEIEKIVDTKQEINLYEGKEGIRAFGRLLMKHTQFFSFGATGRAYDVLYESPLLAKEMIKRGCSGKLITSPKYVKHPMKIKNFQMRFLDIKSEATTTIFGDYISIHLIKEKPLIIVIKNKFIAESYKSHFDVLWNVAKKQ